MLLILETGDISMHRAQFDKVNGTDSREFRSPPKVSVIRTNFHFTTWLRIH
jgi:hypothetical protein